VYLGMATLDNSFGKFRGSKAPKYVNTRAKVAMMEAIDHYRKRVSQSQRYYEKERAEGNIHNQTTRALGDTSFASSSRFSARSALIGSILDQKLKAFSDSLFAVRWLTCPPSATMISIQTKAALRRAAAVFSIEPGLTVAISLVAPPWPY
jgi:hypothetical protein